MHIHCLKMSTSYSSSKVSEVQVLVTIAMTSVFTKLFLNMHLIHRDLLGGLRDVRFPRVLLTFVLCAFTIALDTNRA